MKRIAVVFALPLALAGCNQPTGTIWFDEMFVKNYETRVELSRKFKGAGSYFNFGCRELGAINPEPRAHWEKAEKLFERYAALRQRAENSGLLLEITNSGIMLSPMAGEPIDPEDVGSAKLACLQKQEERLDGIEALMRTLASRLAKRKPAIHHQRLAGHVRR